MKTIRLWKWWYPVALMAFALHSCTDNSEEMESTNEVPDDFIYTPLPDNAEPYKVYGIKHNEKNIFGDKYCIFRFYFGDNPKEKRSVYLMAITKSGELVFAGSVYPPTEPYYKSIDDPRFGQEDCISDYFKIYGKWCEDIELFKYDNDETDEKGWAILTEQVWEPVHLSH